MDKKEQKALEALLALAFIAYRPAYAIDLSDKEIKGLFNNVSDCLSDDDKKIVVSWRLFEGE